MFYKKAQELGIPFNQWTNWLEDQLNRIILSRMMKMSMMNKLSKNKVPTIKVEKVEEDVQKMNPKQVAKMIAKKAPTTTRNGGKIKEFFHFGFMKGKNKGKKAKHQEAEVEKKSIFAEVLEKPAAAPKTTVDL